MSGSTTRSDEIKPEGMKIDQELKSKIITWWKENKTHKGKWTMIGRIAADLELETFPHQYAGHPKEYDWNNDVARITNELVRERIIELSADGRAYLITYNDPEVEL